MHAVDGESRRLRVSHQVQQATTGIEAKTVSPGAQDHGPVRVPLLAKVGLPSWMRVSRPGRSNS